MSTVPRRPRPGPEDRAQTILTQTRGAPSGQGSSSAARPVTASRLNRQLNPALTGTVIVGDTTGFTDAIAVSSTVGAGPDSTVLSAGGVTVGFGSYVQAGSDNGAAYGAGASVDADNAAAFGAFSRAEAVNALALGPNTTASADGSVAIGCTDTGIGARATAVNRIVLGTTVHEVMVRGKLLIPDSGGGTLWQVVVDTSGNLSTVVYP